MSLYQNDLGHILGNRIFSTDSGERRATPKCDKEIGIRKGCRRTYEGFGRRV
jgi:hypothetical protein